MDLMARRFAMMAQVAEAPEQWDYVFTANEDGFIPAVNLTADYGVRSPAGGSVTVAWDMTGYDGGSNRTLIYMRKAESGATQIFESALTEQIGEMTIRSNPTQSGELFISRSWTAAVERYWFKGNYIKIRINNP